MSVRIRPAARADVPLILRFIRELAAYEKLFHEVTASEVILDQSLFGERPFAEALIAESDTGAVGFAVFFHNFSTFVGRPGLYLEDLYVTPEARGQGIGKAILVHLAQLAEARGCGRFEWWVLDWNSPAIEFYRSLGARPMADWTVFRVDGEALRALSSKASV